MAAFGSTTSHPLAPAFVEEAPAPLFLSGFFTTSPRHIHFSEEIHLDVMRDDRAVAIAIQDLSTGPRKSEATKYEAQAFVPPIFWEEIIVSSYSGMRRGPGHGPADEVDYRTRLVEEFRIGGARLQRKLRRAVEQMAGQVLSTGKLDLKDENGVTLYSLDFGPRSTHFPTASATWAADGSTGDPLADLEALAKEIRTNGSTRPNRLVFGDKALSAFLSNPDVQTRLDTRNVMVGQVAPEVRGEGATYQGAVFIGHYRFEMWTYDGSYTDPQTGDQVHYVDPDHVLMMSSDARLDLTFGMIPIITPPDQRALPYLPSRVSSAERGIDMTINSWVSPDGTTLHGSFGTRPLTIPTAIDTFGCLDTTV